MELKVSTRSHAGHALVAITGEIDLYTAPHLQSEFTRLLQEGPSRVVIDMSAVDFCDSTGMNVLLSALKRMKEQEARSTWPPAPRRPQDPSGDRTGLGIHRAR